MTKIFTIPIAPVTKKNHQQIIKAKGRLMVIPSKQFTDYQKACKEYLQYSGEPIDEPIELSCVFSMPTRRRVDLTNLLQSVCDILVHYGILKDDNSKIVASFDGSRVRYDKEFPGTIIKIRSLSDEEIL